MHISTTILSVFFVVLFTSLSPATSERPPLKLTNCKPRLFEVRFKAEETPLIRLYQACAFKTGPTSSSEFSCATFENRIRAKCTKRKCKEGVKCNHCWFRVRQWEVPRFYHNQNGTTPELGRYSVQISGKGICTGPVLEFHSDFADSGEDWFERNFYTTGCTDRVSCYQYKEACWPLREPPFDVAIFAQACNARMYRVRSPTAKSAMDCFKGNTLPEGMAQPVAGDVNGVDCPSRLI